MWFGHFPLQSRAKDSCLFTLTCFDGSVHHFKIPPKNDPEATKQAGSSIVYVFLKIWKIKSALHVNYVFNCVSIVKRHLKSSTAKHFLPFLPTGYPKLLLMYVWAELNADWHTLPAKKNPLSLVFLNHWNLCSRGGWRPWKPTQPTAHTTAPRSRTARRRRSKRTLFHSHGSKLHYRWLQSWKSVRVRLRPGRVSLLTCCLSCPTPDSRGQPEETGRGGHGVPVRAEKWQPGRK